MERNNRNYSNRGRGGYRGGRGRSISRGGGYGGYHYSGERGGGYRNYTRGGGVSGRGRGGGGSVYRYPSRGGRGGIGSGDGVSGISRDRGTRGGGGGRGRYLYREIGSGGYRRDRVQVQQVPETRDRGYINGDTLNMDRGYRNEDPSPQVEQPPIQCHEKSVQSNQQQFRDKSIQSAYIKRDEVLTDMLTIQLKEDQVYWVYPFILPEEVITRNQKLFCHHRIREILLEDKFVKEKSGVVVTIDKVISNRKLGLNEIEILVMHDFEDYWKVRFEEKTIQINKSHYKEAQTILAEIVSQCLEFGDRKDFRRRWRIHVSSDGERVYQKLRYEHSTHELNSKNIRDWFLEKQIFKCFSLQVLQLAKSWFMVIRPSFLVQKKYPNGFDLIQRFRHLGKTRDQIPNFFKLFSIQNYAHRRGDGRRIYGLCNNMKASDPDCYAGSKYEKNSFIDCFFRKYKPQMDRRGLRKEDISEGQPMIEVLRDERAGKEGGSEFYIPQLVSINCGFSCGIRNEEEFLQDFVKLHTNKDNLRDYRQWVDFMENKNITDALEEFGIIISICGSDVVNPVSYDRRREEEKIRTLMEKVEKESEKNAGLSQEIINLKNEIEVVKRKVMNSKKLQRNYEDIKREAEKERKKAKIELEEKTKQIEFWKVWESLLKKHFFEHEKKYDMSTNRTSSEIESLLIDFEIKEAEERDKKRKDLIDFEEMSRIYKEEMKREYSEKKKKEQEEKKEKEEEEKICQICFDKRKSVALGCGHVYCEDCSEKIIECSFCRKKIEIRIKLFR